MAIEVGDTLGDYEVTGILGRGGMGKVFRVRNLVTDREEAMKVVLPAFEENPDLADRFLREIKVHASLRHPNIAALYSALRIGGRLVMTLELVDGVTLEEKLHQGPLTVSISVAYILQALSALGYAHDRGVIHRDIKPANLLLAADGVLKLTDFGIARSVDATRLTVTGVALGTLSFMSPEQIRAEAVDGRSDLYSLGLTFYEMITGRHPIQGDSDHALRTAQLTTLPPEPEFLDPSIPHYASAAIMRAVAKDPADRFQTPAEFANALKNSNRGAPLPASAASPVGRAEFGTTPTAVKSSAASFDAATLDRLTHALAPFLGPIAKILVSRTARAARDLDDLRRRLAAEIPSEEDRRKFLGAVRSLS